MNERIKELANRAMVEREDGWHEFDPNVFAELIVRECIDTVLDSSVEYTTRPRIAEELKEHFGVEEQVQDSKELHTCPYREEIYNDYESLCDCDEEQQYQCAMDI